MSYNRYYQYETSPRKLKPEYEPIKKEYPKKSTAKRVTRKEQAKINKVVKAKIVFYIVICFTALFIISYRYSAIDDTYAVLKSAEDELASIKKENMQLEANIESNLNLAKIEEDAKQLLGMQKLTAEQTVYITLPKSDHVESSSETVKSSDFEENWLSKIVHKIIENFK